VPGENKQQHGALIGGDWPREAVERGQVRRARSLTRQLLSRTPAQQDECALYQQIPSVCVQSWKRPRDAPSACSSSQPRRSPGLNPSSFKFALKTLIHRNENAFFKRFLHQMGLKRSCMVL
jgi:hypothetical protein